MEQAKTFVLTDTRTWRRQVRVFIMNMNKKFESRLLQFTTEHKVNAQQRIESKGRNTPAEYTTSNPVEIDALYRDSAYGKDFYEKGDPEGKKKLPTLIVNDKDREIIALRGLFDAIGLSFDEKLPYDVLKKQYEIHMDAISGKKKTSNVNEIPIQVVDPLAEINQKKQDAREYYESEYGEPVPDIVANDVTFLDGLSNPKFDAKKYIETKLAAQETTEEETPDEEAAPKNEKETLHEEYFKKFNKKVPNMKANDLGWIRNKLKG